MRQNKMNVTLVIAAVGVVVGCSNSGSTDETTTTEAAVKAASPACASARDACKAKLESIAAGIQSACTTRDACRAAFEAAKPELQAAGMECETSIHAACVVDLGGDGGRFGFGDHQGEHDGGLLERIESAACEAAEETCRQTIESLRSMPPMACTTIATACSGQTPMTATDACKTAISDCKAALMTAAAGAHTTCGTGIAAACGGHGG